MKGDAPVHCGKVGGVTRKHFLTYLALSTVSIAQPVFDLYGKNLTVFSAAKLSSLEISVFFGLVMLGPAVVAAFIDMFTRRLGPAVNESSRLVLLAGFSGLLGLAVARWLHVDSNTAAVGLGVAFAVLLPWGFDRFRPVREWSRWLAVLSLALGATTFVQLKPLILPMAGTESGATVGKPDQSVFLVVLDEFPLYALLGPDGTINKERFPGFAALADSSTWYRNNLAASNFTHQAVPAILASKKPVRDGGPFLYSYPQNIFTLYSGAMKVAGTEPVTTLCPPSVCHGASEVGSGFSLARFKRFVKDAGIVYGQRVLPQFLRKRLPAVDQGWGGFAAVRDRFKQQLRDQVFSQQQAVIKGAEKFVSSEVPMVQVVHALMPHAPWRLTPDERVAPLSPEIGTQNPDDEDGVRDTYQTFLYQLAATDRAIDEVVTSLKKSGKWDSTMFVLTADHGISFLPTMPQRNTDFSDMDQAEDIYRVPTFVKFPGQSAPKVDDCATTNLDLLPTVNEVMGLKSSWTFDGSSLAKSCPRDGARTVVSATGEKGRFESGFQAARDRAEYYSGMVADAGDARSIAAVGESAPLIGKPISSDVGSALVSSWTVKQLPMFNGVSTAHGASVPTTVTGVVSMKALGEEGTEGIIAVDGVAAGVIGELVAQEGRVKYTAILDYSLLTAGNHRLELFIHDRSGAVTRVGAPTAG